jgi:hypothetical protein
MEDTMHFRLRTLTLASIAIAALGLASSATPVQPAEKGEHGRHAANANKNRHCVTNLSKPDSPTTCYDTFTAAIAAATGGRITDAPADSRVAMNDQRLLARLNATGDKKNAAAIQGGPDVLVGIIYYDDGFGGPSQSWLGRSCDDITHEDPQNAENRLAYVGDDWNDDFEAFRGFSNCWVRVWEHRDFKGASTPWAPFLSDLGVLNDEGSALAFD